MKHISFIVCMFMLLGMASILFAQLPISNDATLLETVSTSELMIQATGQYVSSEKSKGKAEKDVDKNGVTKAIEDARKAAVYLVLLGGTDPLISTADEKAKFQTQQGFFFDMNNINRYVTWEESSILRKVSINDGRGVKVTKRFKVNKDLISKDLETYGIRQATAELASSLGNPFIMVIPAVEKGQNPIDLLRSNAVLKHGATVIESFLTQRKYDVVVPEQTETLNNLNAAQLNLGDRQDDYAYQLALSIGSDVYITYSGTVQDQGYGTERYAVEVRAYETTTGRLLGSETGYSQARKGDTMISIEEALNGAIDNVLTRINNYWKTDLQVGVQYKVVISIGTHFNEDQIEDIQFAFMDAVEAMSKKSKENITTKQTIDYLIWCDPAKYDKSSKIYRDLKREFAKKGLDSSLKTININRKMILLKID